MPVTVSFAVAVLSSRTQAELEVSQRYDMFALIAVIAGFWNPSFGRYDSMMPHMKRVLYMWLAPYSLVMSARTTNDW